MPCVLLGVTHIWEEFWKSCLMSIYVRHISSDALMTKLVTDSLILLSIHAFNLYDPVHIHVMERLSHQILGIEAGAPWLIWLLLEYLALKLVHVVATLDCHTA